MHLRILVLCALLVTAGTMMGLVGPPVLVPAEGSPISVRAANNVAIGDVNNDGRSDLIVTSGQSRRVTIHIGLGDGRFVSHADDAFDVPESPHEVALGDVNGDKNLDLAFANHDSYRVVLLLGNGRGTFSPHRAPQL